MPATRLRQRPALCNENDEATFSWIPSFEVGVQHDRTAGLHAHDNSQLRLAFLLRPHVQPALGATLVLPPPAAGALRFVRRSRARARRAPDRRETLGVERVDRN